MTSVDSLWMMIFVILIILVVFVLVVQFMGPLFQKNPFDTTCDQYMNILIIEGELTAVEENALELTILGLDFENVVVTVTEASEWGDEVRLIVDAEVAYETMDDIDGNRTERRQATRYERVGTANCLKGD